MVRSPATHKTGKIIPLPVFGIAVNYNVSAKMTFLVAFPHFSPFPVYKFLFPHCNSSASPQDLSKLYSLSALPPYGVSG